MYSWEIYAELLFSTANFPLTVTAVEALMSIHQKYLQMPSPALLQGPVLLVNSQVRYVQIFVLKNIQYCIWAWQSRYAEHIPQNNITFLKGHRFQHNRYLLETFINFAYHQLLNSQKQREENQISAGLSHFLHDSLPSSWMQTITQCISRINQSSWS